MDKQVTVDSDAQAGNHSGARPAEEKGIGLVEYPDSTLQEVPSAKWEVFPYASIGRVDVVYTSDRKESGTGFVWKTNMIVTCRHNFNKYGTTKTASISVGDGGETFDLRDWKYPSSSGDGYDYAVARTIENMSDFQGIDLYPVTNAELAQNPTVMIPGFPADKFGLWMAPEASITPANNNVFLYYHISTAGGMSGSPVLWEHPQRGWVAIGIHVGDSAPINGVAVNEGVRLTAVVIAALELMRSQLPP